MIISTTFITTKTASTPMCFCRTELRIISLCFRVFQNGHPACIFPFVIALLHVFCALVKLSYFNVVGTLHVYPLGTVSHTVLSLLDFPAHLYFWNSQSILS